MKGKLLYFLVGCLVTLCSIVVVLYVSFGLAHYVGASQISKTKDEKLEAFIGIGVQIEQSRDLSNGIILKHVFQNTPAYESGLQCGDVVLAVDDFEVVNMSVEEFRKVILSKKSGEFIRFRVKDSNGFITTSTVRVESISIVLKQPDPKDFL